MTTPDTNDMRLRFEQWARKRGYNTHRANHGGGYLAYSVSTMWAAWQGAESEQPSQGLRALLDEVRSACTRDDDLPDGLLARIDAALASADCNNAECGWSGPLADTCSLSDHAGGGIGPLCPQCRETCEVGTPKPMTQAPEVNTEYWLKVPRLNRAVKHVWIGGHYDHAWLAEGRCFSTEADALAALKQKKGNTQ